MSSPSHIDLVLPVFNPTDDWLSLTQARKTAFERALGERIRLIVIDDGSTQQKHIKEFDQVLPDALLIKIEKNKGKGYALRKGFKKSDASITIFTDGDFPYEYESMVAITKAIENGADVALGHREDDYYNSVPWFRKGLSELFRFVLKRLLRFPITDTQCGLKGMSPEGKKIFLTTTIDRFLVDMEFIKKAVRQKGVVIEPVVVRLRKDVIFSKMGPSVLLREGLNFIRIFFI